MQVQEHSFGGLIVRRSPDRRARQRDVHRLPVQVDDRPAVGCDISRSGLSVVMSPALTIGDVVRVSLTDRSRKVTRPARVARVTPHEGRSVVGLAFLD